MWMQCNGFAGVGMFLAGLERAGIYQLIAARAYYECHAIDKS